MWDIHLAMSNLCRKPVRKLCLTDLKKCWHSHVLGLQASRPISQHILTTIGILNPLSNTIKFIKIFLQKRRNDTRCLLILHPDTLLFTVKLYLMRQSLLEGVRLHLVGPVLLQILPVGHLLHELHQSRGRRILTKEE
jgi:hypothetical protein